MSIRVSALKKRESICACKLNWFVVLDDNLFLRCHFYLDVQFVGYRILDAYTDQWSLLVNCKIEV